MPALTASQIAADVGGRLCGAGDVVVSGVAGLTEARPDQVSFLGNPKYRKHVLASAAGVVLVPPDFTEAPPPGRAWVQCANPSRALTTVLLKLAPPPPPPPPGIHPRACVSPAATVAASASVGPCAVVEAGAVIGENTLIMAGVFIGAETHVGADCLIYPNVTIRERCRLGNRVVLHSGAVIGADGFGFEPSPQGHEKIPQLGIVQIDDDVEIGACTTVDRARFGRTWIQRGVKIDNLVQVAHNVEIGEHSVLMGQAGIAGSAKLGRLVALWGKAGVPGHVTIGDGAQVLAGSGAYGDVAPGEIILGVPGMPRREYLKVQVMVRKLPELYEQLQRLEAEVAKLRGPPPA